MSEIQAAYRINGQLASAEAFYAAACDPRRSMAVEACAGAGKTWMLVARIVRALLDGAPPQDILAITFTRKAAGEMRARLRDELRRCAEADEAQRVATLRAWGMGDAEARARTPELANLQARVAQQGRGVQLRTFHSWFSSLLRGAPLGLLQELGLPLRHELLEDDKRPLPLLWPRFYAALAAVDEDRQAFFDCVARHGRHQTLKALETALSRRVEFALADAAGVAERSVQHFAERMPALAGLEQPVWALAGEAARTRWLAWARVLGAEKNKTPQKAGDAVVDAFADAGAEDARSLSARLAALRKAFFVATEDRLSRHLAGFAAAQEAEAELQTLLQAQAQHEAWLHQQRMLRLTRVLLAAYAQLKRERGWVDMNDLEQAAGRLLADAELSGWLQQRLDMRVRHLLIDEFQDTNPLQWQALYGWLSAYAGSGSGSAPAVFLVGDPKQSIYRFRRAEPQVFKAAQAFVVEGLGGALLSCDHTRRCAPEVVSLLNAAMDEAVRQGEYSGFRAHTTHSQVAGAVLALPAVERLARETGDESGDDEPPWRDSLAVARVAPEEEGSAAREAAQVADWLAQQVAAGEAPDGFMVLARKRSRLRLLHEALRARGLPSEAPGETELGESPAVQDLIALLDALVSPHHHLSLARALRSPLLGWSDADLAALALARQAHQRALRQDDPQAKEQEQAPSWWAMLQSAPGTDIDEALAQRWRQTAQTLARQREWVRTLPPHDALSAIYQDTDVFARYAAAVPASEVAATQARLRDLLALSLAQDGGRFLSAYRFVRLLKAGGLPASQAHLQGAVRLLTIHGAKGLEADTVLLLDTDSPPQRPESMGVLVDWPARDARPSRFVFLASEKAPPLCADGLLQAERQARALEELNALYVALTRAERRLVLSSFVPYQNPGMSWWRRLQAMAQPLPAPVAASDTQAAASDTRIMLAVLPECHVAPQVAPVAAPVDEADARTRIGLAMHRLLQWVPTPARDFRWSEVHRQSVAREFALDDAQADEALTMATRIVQGPAAWVWDAALLAHWDNEAEIRWAGQWLRMDRVVRHRDSGHWWVLDFKSALEPQRQAALREQMALYRRAMRGVYPDEIVRLAFINAAGEWMEVETDER